MANLPTRWSGQLLFDSPVEQTLNNLNCLCFGNIILTQQTRAPHWLSGWWKTQPLLPGWINWRRLKRRRQHPLPGRTKQSSHELWSDILTCRMSKLNTVRQLPPVWREALSRSCEESKDWRWQLNFWRHHVFRYLTLGYLWGGRILLSEGQQCGPQFIKVCRVKYNSHVIRRMWEFLSYLNRLYLGKASYKKSYLHVTIDL